MPERENISCRDTTDEDRVLGAHAIRAPKAEEALRQHSATCIPSRQAGMEVLISDGEPLAYVLRPFQFIDHRYREILLGDATSPLIVNQQFVQAKPE